MTAEPTLDAGVEHAAELPDPARAALRDLVLVLADSKRLLGMRFADFILCAPTLESGIAAASMAQDEWGHSRLSYALLADFGDDPKALEHERGPDEYRSSELLDRPVASWVEIIALGIAFDTALAVQYAALGRSRYTPLRNRVQKMLDEEAYHFQHAISWARRLARSETARQELTAALAGVLPPTLRWFGEEGAATATALVDAGLTDGAPDALRDRLLATLGPLLVELEIAGPLGVAVEPGGFRYVADLDWSGWDETFRRPRGSGPDAETLARVRGDRDRLFLMD